MAYLLSIQARNYSAWEWMNGETAPLPNDTKYALPMPIAARLFDGDRFCPDTQQIVYTAPTRTDPAIPGVLILEGNRTYGRQKLLQTNEKHSSKPHSKHSSHGRLYYRCIPHSPLLPAFLVPYNASVEFSKYNSNQFVLFRYTEWAQGAVGPYGILVETIGGVSHLPSYYRYLLLCAKMNFNTSVIPCSLRASMRDLALPTLTSPDAPVFSIDPEGSKDLDDAFSFRRVAGGGAVVNIYIADVVFWAENLDVGGLWDKLRIDAIGSSTLYLPDGNRPLLPRWISDSGGSLLAGQVRPVVGLELVFGCDLQLVSSRFFRGCVRVAHNFRYESPLLIHNPLFAEFLKFTHALCARIQDSHDLVEYWMTEYNVFAGTALASAETGIFRVSERIGSGVVALSSDEENTRRFLKYYKKLRGKYVAFDAVADIRNTAIRENAAVLYAHASSPLRRMVDIYNQLCLVEGFGGVSTQNDATQEFKRHVVANVDKINLQQSAARRIQSECEMMADFCEYADLSEHAFTGTVVAVEQRGCWVFLEDWTRLVFVKRQETVEQQVGETGKYQIFLFEEEEKAYAKIVVRLVHFEPLVKYPMA